jgi:hypothetical protein
MQTSNLQAPDGTQGPPATVLTLGTDYNSLIFTRLSVKHLVRLRTTCTAAKNIVDALPIWAEILEDMNKMNRYNVSPFDNKPFAWLPKAERDENYVERWAELEGWSKKDPRMRKFWASLTSYGKCAELYVFSRETVERIHMYLPMIPFYSNNLNTDIPWPGCESPSVFDLVAFDATLRRRIWELYDTEDDFCASTRFELFFRLAQLNTVMEDLCRDSGPRWYRVDDDPVLGTVIRVTRGASLQKAIFRFYCCDKDSDDEESRWSRKDLASDAHLEHLGGRRAASERLRHLLGKRVCNRIEVLGISSQLCVAEQMRRRGEECMRFISLIQSVSHRFSWAELLDSVE